VRKSSSIPDKVKRFFSFPEGPNPLFGPPSLPDMKMEAIFLPE